MEGPLVLPEATPQNGLRASLDPEAIVGYLTDVLYATLGATRDELQQYGCLLSPDMLGDSLQTCAKFSQQPQAGLYIHQILRPKEDAKQVNGTKCN